METTYMSINRWLDKEGVVHIHTIVLVSHKKEWNMPFAAIWRDLEIVILSEVSQKEKDEYMISLYVESKIWHKWTYVRNRLPDTENRLMVAKGWGGMESEAGVSRRKLLYMKWIKEALLYGTGDDIPYSIINYNGKEYKKNVWIPMNIYMYNWITLLYSRNEYNAVNQLYFFKKNIQLFCSAHSYSTW